MTYPNGWETPGYYAAQLLPETVPTGWKAPVGRPGIIPPRPLQFGDVLGGAFHAVRFAPTTMFGLTLVVVLAVQLVALGLGFALGNEFGSGLSGTDDFGLGDVFTWTTLTSTLATSATSVVVGIGLMYAVSRAVLGHPTRPAEALRRLGARLAPTLVLALLTGLGTLLLAGTFVLPFLAGDSRLVVLVAVVLVPAAVVVGGWLGVRVLLAPCVVAVEGLGPIRALQRSWALTKGRFWPLAGTYLLASVIISVAASTVSSVFTFAAALLAVDNLEFALAAINVAASVTASVLSLPLTYGVITLLYVDARIRYEGYDLQLSEALYG